MFSMITTSTILPQVSNFELYSSLFHMLRIFFMLPLKVSKWVANRTRKKYFALFCCVSSNFVDFWYLVLKSRKISSKWRNFQQMHYLNRKKLRAINHFGSLSNYFDWKGFWMFFFRRKYFQLKCMAIWKVLQYTHAVYWTSHNPKIIYNQKR